MSFVFSDNLIKLEAKMTNSSQEIEPAAMM
jgi:hypothetical protein